MVFNIEVLYTGIEKYKQAFLDAAKRWELVITGPSYTLFISASVTHIDGPGQILGQAGPDELAQINGKALPIHGNMQFDSADVDMMVENGTFSSVILHEMGHVLGIGTLWNVFLSNWNGFSVVDSSFA
eukprot:TRINITY_DN142348_c0_g1_i1.p3 TRINITY_DN142348_c0_g1~~TRINITY_DN142348_c0_g1_i1.p3  ORF type:complete len:128 (+),score=12.79 TRINITY_DN142348_c0_g1_i1:28-411(+)